MDTLRLREVRPLVEIGQEEVCLLQLQRPLRLLWRWRSGGCLGPAAAAEMNSRQRIHRLERSKASPALDRGATGGWHLDLICPLCSRACRVLFAHEWARRLRPKSRLWACRQCHGVTYQSSNTPGSSGGSRPLSHYFRRHQQEAVRIRMDFMGLFPEDAENLRGCLVYKPPGDRIHRERWEALIQLASAHEELAYIAQMEHSIQSGSRLGLRPPSAKQRASLKAWVSCLHLQLEENSWATRQSSWQRQGKPRGGPIQRARPETS